MSDRRRRRKIPGTDESEDVSESSEDEKVEETTTELDTSKEHHEKGGDSEYESAEEEEEEEPERFNPDVYPADELVNPAEEEGGCEGVADLPEGEEDDFAEDEDDDEEFAEEKREEGDGQESENQNKEKVLDFDEDRRNPQYIPKKGGFYEHDDRLTELEEKEEDKKALKMKKKKLWSDDGKWLHDRFHEDEQNPKSKDELVAVYGYDIRNEDGPPRARRRRRYGRGPSKYTRKWEDEAAYYAKMAPPLPGKRGRGEGFRGNRGGRGRDKRNSDAGYEDVAEVSESKDETKSPSDTAKPDCDTAEWPTIEESAVTTKATNVAATSSSSSPPSRYDNPTQAPPQAARGRGRFTNPRGRGWRGGRGRGATGGRRGAMQKGAPEEGTQVARLTEKLEELTVKEQTEVTAGAAREPRKEAKVAPTLQSSHDQRRQAAVPPRLQEVAGNRPKRYSSQRQRQMPDNMPYQQQNNGNVIQNGNNNNMPPRFYGEQGGYQQSVYPEHGSSNDSGAPQGASPPLMSAQTYQSYDPAYQEAYGMRPMATPPRMYSPVSLAAAQPTVMPAPYIAPAGNMMSYGPPPATYTQYTFQQYPVGEHPLENPMGVLQPRPQEVFRGGMAYYNTQPPVRTLPKRPRAAIPIVPPPELEGHPYMENSYEEVIKCEDADLQASREQADHVVE